MDESLKEWLENPYWREYYEKAPSDKCREFITLEFRYNDTEEEEDARKMDEAESRLDVEDLKHLAKFEGNTPRKAELMRKIRSLGG